MAQPDPTKVPPSQSSIGERLNEGWRSFLGTAKAARDLTAAQLRRAKLSRFNLPAAYLALGKTVFESGSFKGEFADLFDRIETTKAEIERLGQRSGEQPQGTNLTDKLRAGAVTLKVKAQQKALSAKLNLLYRELGEKTFDAHDASAGPQDLVGSIVRSREQIESLDREIVRLSDFGKGKLLTPKRLIGACVVAVLLLGMLILFQPETTESPSSTEDSMNLAGENQASDVHGVDEPAVDLNDVLLLAESPEEYVGRPVFVSGTQVSVVSLERALHTLTLDIGSMRVRCDLHPDHVKRAYRESGPMAVIGTFAGRNEAGMLHVTDCRFADKLDLDPEFAKVRSFEREFFPLENSISRNRALQLMAVHVYAQLMSSRGRDVRAGPDQINGLMKGAAIYLGCQRNPEMRMLQDIQPDDRSSFEVDGKEYVILLYGDSDDDVFFYFSSKPPHMPFPSIDSVLINGRAYSTGER
ncbi:MAG: hypothetical protein KY476_06275 [Planctomycetes bacterium]|nr:hypothetical protein [Planctomycetota bacterium]